MSELVERRRALVSDIYQLLRGGNPRFYPRLQAEQAECLGLDSEAVHCNCRSNEQKGERITAALSDSERTATKTATGSARKLALTLFVISPEGEDT